MRYDTFTLVRAWIQHADGTTTELDVTRLAIGWSPIAETRPYQGSSPLAFDRRFVPGHADDRLVVADAARPLTMHLLN